MEHSDIHSDAAAGTHVLADWYDMFAVAAAGAGVAGAAETQLSSAAHTVARLDSR